MASPSTEAELPVAVVTGGASGIGRAITLALRAGGHPVAIVDRDRPSDDVDATFVRADVTSRDDLERAAGRIEDVLGPIGILVNGAGVFEKSPALEYDDSVVRRILAINLEGVLLATSVFGRRMAARRHGRIVNIASIAAHAGAALASAYAASKAGLVAATQSHARELAPLGISVNAILPGYCDTPMLASERALVHSFVVPRIPLRRVARPEEIAEVVVALVSLRTPYLTGAAIPIDGGLHVG